MNAKDTPPDVAERYRKMLMARSGEQRLRMGSDMWDAAVAMFFATLPAGLSERERRARLLVRFYGRDLPAEFLERAVERIRRG